MFQWLYDNFVNPEEINPAWFAWVGGSVLSLWIIFWWSIGMLPSPAFGAGFSKAEQVNRVEARIIKNEVIEVVARRCQAPTPQSKQYFTQRLEEKQADYYAITGQRIEVPTCQDLGLTT